MSKTFKVLSVVFLFMAVGAVAIADSHEEKPIYVWISMIQAKPGQSQALTGYMIEEGMKNYDPLVASGAAADWGVAMPIVHDGNDPYSHVEWVAFMGWEAVDAFMGAFMAKQQSMSPEEMAAADEKWQSMVVDGSHSDQINRSIHIGSSSPVKGSYIHLGYFSAKPGKASAVKDVWGEFAAPIYDQLIADGSILNYGLHVPAIHRGENWTHLAWYLSENLAARDAVGNAFDAAEAARSEDEAKAWQSRMMETFEREHEDQILVVAHHGVGGGGE
jgi:hypothetical protein